MRCVRRASLRRRARDSLAPASDLGPRQHLDVGRYLSYDWCQSVSASASSPARAMGAERENGGSRRRDSLGGGELSVCIIGDVHHR
jgi:hypothetical protein